MQYDMTAAITEIAAIEKVSPEKVADELELDRLREKFTAHNRRQESEVLIRLSRLKSDIQKIELAKEVLLGYHWVKDEEGWAVKGDFTGKHEGDEIIVLRRDGTKQIKMIERFSNIGNAYVY